MDNKNLIEAKIRVVSMSSFFSIVHYYRDDRQAFISEWTLTSSSE